MRLYCDTSAIVPLIFLEPHTDEAQAAARLATEVYAWRWLEVEAHAAIARRGGTAADQKSLRRVLDVVQWIDILPEGYADVCAFNQRHRLRASDAGHLFGLRQAVRALPDLAFVCFDGDLRAAAERERLRIWAM